MGTKGTTNMPITAIVMKGKKFSRASMKEGAHELPWEREAYKNK